MRCIDLREHIDRFWVDQAETFTSLWIVTSLFHNRFEWIATTHILVNKLVPFTFGLRKNFLCTSETLKWALIWVTDYLLSTKPFPSIHGNNHQWALLLLNKIAPKSHAQDNIGFPGGLADFRDWTVFSRYVACEKFGHQGGTHTLWYLSYNRSFNSIHDNTSCFARTYWHINKHGTFIDT